MSETLFLERYNNLNAEQKKAVDTIDGPVLVVAGPGTGKTEILTLRIANILRKTDTAPENILALTFTDAAAANMRKRLAALIGPRAYRVAIETFHSFCNNVIKDYPEYFPTIIGSGNITEVEGLAILEEIMSTLPLDILRPWGDRLYYIKDIYHKIEELKREGVSPDQFCTIIDQEEKNFGSRTDLYHEKGAYKGKMKAEHKEYERKIAKNKELCDMYVAYQKMIHGRRLYDWSDMIMEVLRAIESSPDLKLQLQENHQYILVDEHQDTNNAQNKILTFLGDFHQNPNVFIVGDEKQAIFRFQGASMENFLYFKKLYPGAVLVELKNNYRSRQAILDAAHSLIASRQPLEAHGAVAQETTEHQEIGVASFSSKSHELHFVAEEIKKIIAHGEKPEEIAVIYRTNREAFPMSLALDKAGVPYVIQSDEDLLSETFVRRLLAMLEAIFYYGQDQYLIPVLHLDEFGIDPLEAYRLISMSSKREQSLYNLVAASDNESIRQLGEKIKGWVKASQNEHLSQFLEQILRESGLLSAMVESRDSEAFLGIERLFEEGKRISENRPGATFKDFMEYVRILRERKIFIKRPKHAAAPNAVRLMTAHRSKGLEFAYVYIINATERSFGEKADRDSLPLLPAVYRQLSSNGEDDGAVAEERRLFYVALTRAKKSVLISYATMDESGKELLPSPFVEEIRADRKTPIDTEPFEAELKAHPEVLYAERQKTGTREVDQAFVTELFQAHPLSVTALNNYLSCPWKYFYRNLLRIPSVPERHQLYGTAMHAAVEDLWRVMKERDVTVEFLLDAYKRHLGLLGILTERETAEALKRGQEALAGWYAWAQPKLTNPVISEFTVPRLELAPGIHISGKLDKVEMTGDRRAIVTDYKTGKQKSRNVIEGKTKDSSGDMKRQLQFYKLLLQLHDSIDMEEGVIEFLEPSDSGQYKREAFEISDTEVTELKETIVHVADEITSLAFWDKRCDDKECEYCAYRNLIR